MGKHTKRSRIKGHKKFKVLCITLLILIILLGIITGGAYWYINDKLGRMQRVDIDKSNLGITDEANENLAGYRNIALLGIDTRADNYSLGNRSDCIIIASINNKTNEVELTSVYRDTYLKIEGHGLDKVTHAYSYGGPELTLKTLNTNLGLNITEFITVNFDAVKNIVDSLGGININIDNSELQYINSYIDATSSNTGTASSHITKTGTQVLDGVQAVAYSRIRYTSGGDYKRTERMRTVIEACFAKLKTKNIAQMNSLANRILPQIYSNISSNEIISLIPKATSFNIIDSIGWPYDVKGITLDRWYGVPVTLESNVLELHKNVFKDENYTISNEIKTISNQIVSKTGYTN